MVKYIWKSVILVIVSFAIISCFSKDQPLLESYDFTRPNLTLFLPDTLREISGLTLIDSTTLGCVQDENGILFFYDINKKEIVNQFKFEADGDYEGLARVDNDMYILRSDGTIFELQNFQSPNYKTVIHQTQIPAPNNEGFCYDKTNNRLLIGCKGKLGKGKEFKDLRAIYAFDLKEKMASEDPVHSFDLKELKQFAENNRIPIPKKEKKGKHKKGKKEEPDIKLMISALAIHPYTKEVYMLSATDHLLIVFSTKGTLKQMHVLDKKIFNKAEGIIFANDGTLYVSNEAQDKKPTILEFFYQR